MPRAKSKGKQGDTHDLAVALGRACADLKCSDILILDVREISQVCDYLVIASGTSARQMRSVAEDLDKLGAAQGSAAWKRESDSGYSWLVVDFVHVVVHLFEPMQRVFYDLEGLWSDAPRISWSARAAKH